MKKLIVGSLLAAVALFIWGAIYWTNPLTYSFLERAPDETAAAKALLEIFPNSGTYLLPHPGNSPEMVNKLSLSGPIATVYIERQGRPAMEPSVFVFGFLHGFVTVLLIGILLKLACPALVTYGSRLRFVFLAGLTMAIFAHGGEVIWWHHPWNWPLVTGVYDVSGWLVAGLILAGFVKPGAPNVVQGSAQTNVRGVGETQAQS